MLVELSPISGMPTSEEYQWGCFRLPSCKSPRLLLFAGFLMSFFLRSMGPCLGPLLGGWIYVGTHSWRWIYWVLFIFLGCIFAFTLFAPETYAPILLKKKAARLRKEHNSNSYRAAHELERIPLSTTLKVSLCRPFIMMFKETIILCMSIYLSFIYSLLYLLFFAFPIAFEEVRGWNPGTTGTAFVAVMVSSMISSERVPRTDFASVTARSALQ